MIRLLYCIRCLSEHRRTDEQIEANDNEGMLMLCDYCSAFLVERSVVLPALPMNEDGAIALPEKP